MKKITISFFFTLIFLNIAKAEVTNFSCPNRVVTIILPSTKVEILKSKFVLISSLPFDLKSEKISKIKSRVKVSYRKMRVNDQYPTPKNPYFFKRVTEILLSSEKDLEIEKMTAQYFPLDEC